MPLVCGARRVGQSFRLENNAFTKADAARRELIRVRLEKLLAAPVGRGGSQEEEK